VAGPQGSDEIDGDPVDAAGHQPGILAQVTTLILQAQSDQP
jgi:hypothetical protein